MKLKDKVAIVTGASSGIGEAVARRLASEGARVALLARRADRLLNIAKELESEHGRECLVAVSDVSDAHSVKKAIELVIEKFGRLDILVNNAGVMFLGSVADAKIDDWRKMIDINVLGLMYATHFALPHLKKEGGDIVNISSVSGRVVSARSAAYSATKFAVNGFSEGLRQEAYKDKVRVTIIEPGAVETELTDHIPDASVKDAVKSWVSSMTALQSNDIAEAVLYAVSQPWHVSVNEIMVRPTEQSF